MKKNIALIISIIAFIIAMVAFCSKVNGQKKTRKKNKIVYGTPLTANQVNASAGTFHYNPEPGTVLNVAPITVGSYAVASSLTNTDYNDKKYKSDFWDAVLTSLSYLWYIIPLMIVILILILKRKDEEITLPDEYNV